MDPIVDTENFFPQLKDVEVKSSRRVLFDLQGQVFGISVDMLKQVPCLLAHLSDDLRFKNKEPDGTVFINRSPKHFQTILTMIQHFNSPSLWPSLPSLVSDREELLVEADFYSLPPELMDALRSKVGEEEDKTRKQMEDLQAQIASLKKELEICQENLGKEIQAKNDISAVASDSCINTNGCYISVSDISFSLRVCKDFSKIVWSGYRSLEKVNVGPSYGKAVFEMRPLGALEAHVVLWNNLKSYVLCERRTENNMGTRIDLCSMGNGELLVIIETSPKSDPLHYHSSSPPLSHSPPSSHHSHSHSVSIPSSPSKNQPSMEERFAIASNLSRHSVPGFQRITCRFQPDPK